MLPEVQLVFCDDIRREDNGKLILIGVYAEDLVPSAIPTTFPLSVWIKMKGLAAGTQAFQFKLHYPNDRNFNFNGSIEVASNDMTSTLVFAGFPAEVQKPGEIRATMKLGDDEEFDVGVLPVRAPWEKQVSA